MTTLYYVYDPMCSWCWAYRPILAQVRRALQNHPINIEMVLGGLAEDSDEPMPYAQQKQIQAIWRRIEEETGTVFNHDFWQYCEPRRSTWPACRAVLAAEKQDAGEKVLHAIQEAYYLRAMNPSDDEVLLQLADELELDFDRFEKDFYSEAVAKELAEQIAKARSMPIEGFPSWVVEHKGQLHKVALDYHSQLTTLAALGDIMKN